MSALMDEDPNYVPRGTLAIAIASVGGWDQNGAAMATVTSAVCIECGEWATEIVVSGVSDVAGDRVAAPQMRRQVVEIVYSCDLHLGQITSRLLDSHGWCTNSTPDLDLAHLVEKRNRGGIE